MKHHNPRLTAKAYLLFTAILISVHAFCNQPDTLIYYNNAKAGTTENQQVKSDVYHVNYPITGSIIGVGMVGDYFAIPRIMGKDNITDVELNALNPGIINPIDQWGLKQDASQRSKFGHISDYYMSAVFLLPGLLVLNKKIRKEWGDLLMMYAEGHIITFTFYNYSWLGPTFNNKYRPVTYYTELPVEERHYGNNRNSFYSGHTASTAYTTFFMAKVYCDFHPDLSVGKKVLVYTAAFVPAALEGYFRVRSLAHFPSDNMVGLTLGAAIGIIVPQLHKNHVKNLSVGMFNVPGGMGLSTCLRIP